MAGNNGDVETLKRFRYFFIAKIVTIYILEWENLCLKKIIIW